MNAESTLKIKGLARDFYQSPLLHCQHVLTESLIVDIVTSWEQFRIQAGETLSPLALSLRIENCLKSAGINTLEKLLEHSEADLLRATPGLGRKGLYEIADRLAARGLALPR